MDIQHPFAAIVDYGLGNLHSVQQACTYVGLTSVITNSKQVLLSADAVILPGVGAYGDAMQELHRLDLAEVLLDLARSEKPLVGICLGLQLLMTESSEFGHHRGLGIIEGPVVRFDMPKEDGKILKIPHVNWNSILHTPHNACWDKTLLSRVKAEHLCILYIHIRFSLEMPRLFFPLQNMEMPNSVPALVMKIYLLVSFTRNEAVPKALKYIII